MTPNARRLLAVEVALCGGPITVAAPILILIALILAFDTESKADFYLFSALGSSALYSIALYWRLAICTIGRRRYPFGAAYYIGLISAAISTLGLAVFMPPLLFLAALTILNASKLLRIQKSEIYAEI